MALQSQTQTKVLQTYETNLVKKEKSKKKRWYEFETDIIWGNSIFIISLHALALYYVITFPYFEHPVLFVWGWAMGIISGLGVTGGAHRLWTHRAYKAYVPLRIIWATFYYSAGMNPIFNWTRDHRVHHKYSDTRADPHDTNRGFWFSHCGWLMMKKRPEVKEKGKEIDMSDVLNDPVVQFFDGHYWLLNLLLTFLVPTLIPYYFWNQSLYYSFVSQAFIRYPVLLNVTWSINSFAHMYGYHTYDKSITAVENVFVSYLTGGESYHNYHHVFPWDYKASEYKSFFSNTTTTWIDFFAMIGWAYDLRTVSLEQIRLTINRRGDGTHPIYGKLTQRKLENKLMEEDNIKPSGSY